MPPFLLLAVAGLIAYYGFKRLQRDAERVISQADLRRQEESTGADGTLEKDPDTGVYRLRKPDQP